MANSRKFVAKTKDVSLTVRRVEFFLFIYVNCEKDVAEVYDKHKADFGCKTD